MSFQISRKFRDGTIVVISADTMDEFLTSVDAYETEASAFDTLKPYSFGSIEIGLDTLPERVDSRPGDVSHVDIDYTKPVPAHMLPPELDGQKYDYWLEWFDKIVVTPVGKDRATIQMYANHLEFPVGAVANKWKLEDAAKVFAPYGDLVALLDEAWENREPNFTIEERGKQYYYQGRQYEKKDGSKGHYKNLALIERPIE